MNKCVIPLWYSSDSENCLAEISALVDMPVRDAKLLFRSAHRIAQLAQTAAAQNILPSDIRVQHVGDAARQILGRALGLFDHIVRKALDARYFILLRTIPGESAPDTTRTIIAQQLTCPPTYPPCLLSSEGKG